MFYTVFSFSCVGGVYTVLLLQSAYNKSPGKFFILFIFYYCTITPFSTFPPLLFTTLPTPTSNIQSLPQVVFVHGSFIHVPWWLFPFLAPLSPSLLSSGYCYFVLYFPVLFLFCSFVLLIRFHLQVRSNGICFLPPVLFHLA